MRNAGRKLTPRLGFLQTFAVSTNVRAVHGPDTRHCAQQSHSLRAQSSALERPGAYQLVQQPYATATQVPDDAA